MSERTSYGYLILMHVSDDARPFPVGHIIGGPDALERAREEMRQHVEDTAHEPGLRFSVAEVMAV